MNIRRAAPDDAEALARVHIASWLTTYKGIVPEEELRRRSGQTAQRAQRWRDDLSASDNKTSVFVADVDGVVGFATGGLERDGDPVHKGELRAIYVLEQWQRKGIGRQLTLAMMQDLRARGLNSMLVWVLRDNPNRAFYERLGGTLVGEKEIAFGECKLLEVAYGWSDLNKTLQLLGRGDNSRIGSAGLAN